MKNYIAKNILDMPFSGIRKFFDIVSSMDDAVSLGVGEPDFETPWVAREAAIRSLEKGKTSYTSNQGMFSLRSAICDYLEERFSLQYSPDNETLVTVGASEGIDVALRAIVDPGDEVLIIEPSYVSYKPCISMAGGISVVIPTFEENDFRVTPEDIEQKITEKTKAIILPYPNNPTGGILGIDELKKIAQICIKYDLVVISDEIYAELTYGQTHASIASLPGMRERTIVLNGFSKAFAMTGWRLGYAVGPQQFIKSMTKIHQYIIMCAPTTSQYAGFEALMDYNRNETIEIMRDAYDERRQLMVNSFRDMGLSCFEPKGAFYVFPSIKSTGLKSDEFCNELLKKEKVAVVPGTAFGESGEGYVRCSYAYSIDKIKVALDRIYKFLDKR